MTTAIERLPKRLFAVLLGVVLALGLVPGLGARVAFAQDAYTLTVKGGDTVITEDKSYQLNAKKQLSLQIDDGNYHPASVAVSATSPITATGQLISGKAEIEYSATAEGTGTITIEHRNSEGTKTGETKVTVSCTKNSSDIPVESVKLDQTAIALNKGETLKLTATVSPEDATDARLNWTSSDLSVATVDSLGNVKAEADGEAIITATSMDGSKKSATCTVTVYNPVESITLDKKTAELTVGDKLQLKATVMPKGASENVDWETSDKSIATVDSNGNVEAVAPGTATITVKSMADMDKTSTCEVTVTEKPEPTPAPVKPTYAVTDGDDSTWTRGSGKDLTFTFERDTDDDTTFSKHFKGIQVDGADVKADNYTASEGSVVITLKAAYLEKLKVGKHTITAVFDDGTADAKFTIAKAAASSKSTSPKTGDMLPVALIAGLAVLAVIVLIVSRVLSRKQEPTDKNTN